MELLYFAQKQKLWSFTLSSASFFVSFDYVFLLRASAIFKARACSAGLSPVPLLSPVLMPTLPALHII